MYIVLGLVSVLFPGVGASYARQWRLGALWMIASIAISLGLVFSVWLFTLVIAIHLASVIDASYRVRRARMLGEPRSKRMAAIHILLLLAFHIVMRFGVVADYRIRSVETLPTLQTGDFIGVDKLSPRWRPIEPGELIAYRSPCLEAIYVHRVIATAGQRVEIRCDTVYVDDQPIAEQAVPGTCTYDWHDELADEEWGWTTEQCSEYVETLGAHSYHVLQEANRAARDADKAAIKVPLAWDFPVLTDEPQASCAAFVHYDFHAPGSVTAHRPVAGVGVCERQFAYVVPAGQLFMLADNRHASEDSRRFGAVPVANVIGRVREIFATDGKFGWSFARVSNIH